MSNVKYFIEVRPEDILPGGKYFAVYQKCASGKSIHLQGPKKKKKVLKHKKASKKPVLKNIYNIAVDKRLNFLLKMVNSGFACSPKSTQKKRAYFEKHKHSILPLAGKSCYVCDNEAALRHHVVPLNRGGDNTKKNIVPLCELHHEAVHPWMTVKLDVVTI